MQTPELDIKSIKEQMKVLRMKYKGCKSWPTNDFIKYYKLKGQYKSINILK